MKNPRRSIRTAAFVLSLLAAALTVPAPAAYAADTANTSTIVEVRLGDDVVPTFEAVRLRLDPSRPDYSGSVRVDLEARRAASAFRFHAEGQTLGRVALFQGEKEIPIRYERGERGVVTVTPGRPLSPGAYRLEADFTQQFNTQVVSLYRVQKDGEGYVFTQFEADEARQAFPCWDEPIFKIPYQLTIEAPAAHEVITNTPVESWSPLPGSGEDGAWKTVVFKRSPPLPSYLLGIASGPFDLTPIPGLKVPGRIASVRGQGHLANLAASITAPLLGALETYFARPYPYEKLDLIAVPEFWPGAMENPGIITYADRILLVDPANASVSQRRLLTSVHAHELAHMWFGDLVTLAWWNDLWLNESFADWMGDKVTDQVHPEYGLPLAELQTVQNIMTQDGRPSTDAIRRSVGSAENVLDNVGLAYNKGKAVLAMFEAWMGPETFRKGVNLYLKQNEWGNATADDLWKALSGASGKDVGAVMAGFLDQPGLPLVTVEPVEPIPGNQLRLTQRRFANEGVKIPPQTWKIPVVLEVSDGKTVKKVEVLLTEPSQTVKAEGLDSIAWVMPNAEAEGYYRWAVPAPMLAELAKRSVEVLDPRERVGLLGNLTALLDAGEVHGDVYLEVLNEMANDPDPQVISALLGSLTKVRQAFVPDGQTDLFAAYVRSVLGPAYRRFGLEKKPGEAEAVSLVRPRLVEWLGRTGRDEAVLRSAREIARRYMAGEPVDPSLSGSALELAAIDGDRALFDEYRRRFEGAQVPAERERYLDALGDFRDPAIQDEALKYALEGPLRPNEVLDIPLSLAGDGASGKLFQWIRQNYSQIVAKVPPVSLPHLPRAADGCSEERLQEARDFFSDPGHAVPGTKSQLARVADEVADCVRLRRREGAAVAGYLRTVASEGKPAVKPAGATGGS